MNNNKEQEKINAQCLNSNGQWVPAIVEPYYHLFRKECNCGQKFWTYDGYRGHYALKHILAL